MLTITDSFDDTLAPPIIAVTGLFGFFRSFCKESISLCSKSPAHFISKNFATVAVEACSLCVVPKASLIYISAKVDNLFANASSAAVSSGLNLRFSNSATSPFLRCNSWCLSLLSKKSEINFTLRFNKCSSSGIIFFRVN